MNKTFIQVTYSYLHLKLCVLIWTEFIESLTTCSLKCLKKKVCESVCLFRSLYLFFSHHLSHHTLLPSILLSPPQHHHHHLWHCVETKPTCTQAITQPALFYLNTFLLSFVSLHFLSTPHLVVGFDFVFMKGLFFCCCAVCVVLLLVLS